MNVSTDATLINQIKGNQSNSRLIMSTERLYYDSP